jgi:hypothetical protein
MSEIFEGGKHCRSGPFVRRYFNLWLRTPEKAPFYDMHLFLTTRYLNPRLLPPRTLIHSRVPTFGGLLNDSYQHGALLELV